MMGRNPYRHYRRYARRSWRRGGYPVMLLGTGEPVTLIAMAAIGRWAYRHRSAFSPFLITAAEFIGAAVLHRHHQHWWIAVTAITATVSIVLGIPHRIMQMHPSARFTTGTISRAWEACGIDRPAERAYATTILAVGGGWLAAAIAIGPAVKPLPAIAVTGMVVLGIPWWAHRRRRARVRAIRTIQAWPQLADNMGLPGSSIASIVVDAWGWTARVILRKGTTAAQAIGQLPAIESGLGIRPGTARAIPDPDRADRIILRVIEKDPHAQPIPWREPASTTITSPIDVGFYEDGRPVAVAILRRNVLIAGTTGAGKSGIVNIVVAALVKCADAHKWGIDLKGGMELQPWAQCLHKPLATTPEAAISLLGDANTELERRAGLMTARGLRLWEPTPDDPAIEIIIDEYAELPPEAQDHTDSIARRGRAVAVNLIIATQRPTQEAMGRNAVRSLMDVRICLRVRERRDTDLILGQGSLAAGWDAHALTQPGTFLLADPEHTTPERARAYLITDDQVTARAARHTTARGQSADTAPGHAEPSPDGAARPPADDEPTGPPGAAGALWDTIRQAGPDGVPVADLMAACGMSRSWVYYRLREHAQSGRVVQTVRGTWRAVSGAPGGLGDGRPPPRPRTRRRDRLRPPRGDRQ